MVRRRRGASFMASAYVFPGGGVDPGETDRECAARELFEEAGVALVTAVEEPGATAALEPHQVAALASLRAMLVAGKAPARQLLAQAGLRWDVDALVPWAHWITPSLEPKRFAAQFFLASLPAGQAASADEVEAVEQRWVAPARVLDLAKELALPPPQLRTLWELQEASTIDAAMVLSRARSAEPHPILPRAAMLPARQPEQGPAGALCLLLPWDPEYLELGQGDAHPMADLPSWARGPSRFVLDPSQEERGPRIWRHLHAPGLTTAG